MNSKMLFGKREKLYVVAMAWIPKWVPNPEAALEAFEDHNEKSGLGPLRSGSQPYHFMRGMGVHADRNFPADFSGEPYWPGIAQPGEQLDNQC